MKKIQIHNLFLILSVIFLLLPFLEIQFQRVETEKITSANVLFIIDVSKSMTVLDISDNTKKISRLDGSKKIVNQFILEQNTYSYGLMAFAGEVVEILPFTNDLNIFKTLFQGIDEHNIAKSGTDFSSVFSGISSFFIGEEESGTVVIFTDGGDEINNENIESIIKKFQEKNIKIIIVGVGTDKGDRIPIGTDPFGKMRYKVYSGKEIISKLSSDQLKKFSEKYNFHYLHFDSLSDFKIIKDTIKENLYPNKKDKNSIQTGLTREFIFIAFIFFIIFLGLEYRKNKKI